MATESSKTKRYKNIDRQMLYDDLLAAAKSMHMTVTRYAISIGGDSNTQSRIMGDKHGKTTNPTEYMLRQMARDLTQAGYKRRWRDYLLPEEHPEPEQIELDLTTNDIDPKEILEEYLEGMRKITAAILCMDECGYRVEISIKKQGGAADGKDADQ